ncbi:MAG TPA: Mu transposase C-terminal domain-containing protein [bacterium]|nr:Mu transposase C-terminal domain-containing protein [bacterium]
MSALEKNERSDIGVSRSIDKELGELIITMKKENPHRSFRQIETELIMAEKIKKKEISRSSVYRLLANHKTEIESHRKKVVEKRRYEFEFSNECWQSDVKHGPYLKIEGHENKKKIFLFGFLDDASRVMPHGQIFLAENLENFKIILKTAIMKKGIPERLYLDNAGYFRSPTVKTIGARFGIKVIYCTPYSPYKKGKIERFWRTCDEQFITNLDRNKIYSLQELNNLFLKWLETCYHHYPHSSLNSTPIEAWQKKSKNIHYPDSESIAFDFLEETIRKVRNDGTFSLNGIIYEVDSLLHGQAVTVRFDPADLKKIFIYGQDGKFFQEARPVDLIENSKTGRAASRQINDTPVSSGISFMNLLEKKEDANV